MPDNISPEITILGNIERECKHCKVKTNCWVLQKLDLSIDTVCDNCAKEVYGKDKKVGGNKNVLEKIGFMG